MRAQILCPNSSKAATIKSVGMCFVTLNGVILIQLLQINKCIALQSTPAYVAWVTISALGTKAVGCGNVCCSASFVFQLGMQEFALVAGIMLQSHGVATMQNMTTLHLNETKNGQRNVTCDRFHKISFALYHLGSSTEMAASARSCIDFVNLFNHYGEVTDALSHCSVSKSDLCGTKHIEQAWDKIQYVNE